MSLLKFKKCTDYDCIKTTRMRQPYLTKYVVKPESNRIVKHFALINRPYNVRPFTNQTVKNKTHY